MSQNNPSRRRFLSLVLLTSLTNFVGFFVAIFLSQDLVMRRSWPIPKGMDPQYVFIAGMSMVLLVSFGLMPVISAVLAKLFRLAKSRTVHPFDFTNEDLILANGVFATAINFILSLFSAFIGWQETRDAGIGLNLAWTAIYQSVLMYFWFVLATTLVVLVIGFVRFLYQKLSIRYN